MEEEKSIARHIACKLVEAREENKLSQKDVSKSGITSQTNLSRFENGERLINLVTLWKLSKFYNKSIEYFFPS